MTQGEPIVEVWHGDRKVTVYQDVVIRVWGVNIETEMSDEPRTLDTVQSAFDWLYSANGEITHMMRPTLKLQFVRRRQDKDVIRVLQQQWIDDDPPDEGAPREVWRDVPCVDEPPH